MSAAAGPGPPVAANVDRLHAFMDRAGLAAVAVRSGQNFTYLSGCVIPGTYGRALDLTDSPRGPALLWPRQGEPVMVRSSYNRGTEAMIARDAWVTRMEVYQAYVEAPLVRLCRAVRDAGLDRERIGFEKSYLSAEGWEEIRRQLPHVDMVDCTALLDGVRSVKTPAEVALLERAANLLDEVYLEAFAAVRAGETERELHRRIVSGCLDRGAEWVHGAWAYGVLNTRAEGQPFRAGDVIRTDYIAYLRGYPGHQSRNAVLGRPSADQRREYATYRDLYLRTIEQCRPGIRAGDVFEFVVDEFRRHGWTYTQVLVGHSVGPWWHQQEPILARGRTTVIEEGMVLAIEPITERWYLQDLFAIGAHGAERLSRRFPTEEIFAIG